MSLTQLTAMEIARRIRDGEVTSEEVVQACLDHIGEVEDTVQAWTHLDANFALEQARNADAARQSGAACGPLHGVPVGVKDIFDTSDLPTEDGTVIHAGRQPKEDCTVVRLLKEAGAVIMGKTVTTELAVYAPGKTRNPHNPEHTPGGSSSGSAAAVAAHMVPLAIGSQTNGSVIRPAAYCGVCGFKPTHGLISRHGVLALSRVLDVIGVMARTVDDAALIAETLMAFDDRDPDMRLRARPALVRTASEEPPVTPQIAFVRSPVWDEAEDQTKEAFAEIAEFLGEGCDDVALPGPFDSARALHRTIMCADLAKSFAPLYERDKDKLSDTLRGMIEEGRKTLAVDYNVAIDWIDVLYAGLEEVFERYDAILTPATTGEAPRGLDSTGDPVFCTLWTLCGTPAVTLPLLQGSNGLPIGVQLVGPRGEDARLLRTANWLVRRIESGDQE